MAITLPTTPADNDTATMGSVTYTYDSATDKWVGTLSSSTTTIPTKGVITGTAAQDYQTSAVAPTTKSADGGGGALIEGDLWYDTTNDTLFVRSGASTWLSSTPSSGGGGGQGFIAGFNGSFPFMYGAANTTYTYHKSSIAAAQAKTATTDATGQTPSIGGPDDGYYAVKVGGTFVGWADLRW